MGKKYIIADNQELTRYALEGLVRQRTGTSAEAGSADIYRASDKTALVERLKEHENAVVLLDYTLFDFADEEQLLIVTERFSLSQWILISDELSPQFLRRVVYSSASHMFRKMMNREKTIMGTSALLLSGSVGVVMACNGFSYWSLAAQQLVYITVVNLFRYYYVRWRPAFYWDFASIRQMFVFSSKILVTNIINCFSANIFTLIFGRLFTERVVGNYTQANKWNTMAYSFVSGTLQQIAQPVLASVSDEQDRQLRIFRKILRFTAFLAFPAMLGLAAVSKEFIAITLGAKWADSAILLQILCISGAFMPLHTVYQNLAISKKRSDIYMWCNITLMVLQVVLILACRQQGVIAMVTVYSVLYVAWLLVWQLIAQRLIGIRSLEFAKDILPFLLAAAGNIGLVYWLTNGIPSPILQLLCRIAACGALYFLTLKMAHAKILEECMDYLLRKHKNETR